MLLQFLLVLTAIIIGVRLGGIGLGLTGGLGLTILTFVFGLQPTSPPIDVILMIIAVVSASACMQAAGGIDYLVRVAEKLLRKNPGKITILSPLVTYLLTFVSGTGHIVYSVLPIIAEVAAETKVRPERPLGIAVIASQQAITASPVSAATVTLLFVLTPHEISLLDILIISIPATFIGCFVAAIFSMRVGKDLNSDSNYTNLQKQEMIKENSNSNQDISFNKRNAVKSVIIFLITALLIVLFGSIDDLRPIYEKDGVNVQLGMHYIIEILMLTAAALILLLTKTSGQAAGNTSIFGAGMNAVICIFGIAWLGDTFIQGNLLQITNAMREVINQYPWVFGIALFLLSMLLYSQAATTKSMMPLALVLGISPYTLIALFPAVNGYFFIPSYPTIIAAINFDRTGTTKIGKYILNHSFMMPGIVATVVAIVIGFGLVKLLYV